MVAELYANLAVSKGSFSLRVDLTFPSGVTALLGASGAGKSTLVAALVGASRPDAGELRFGNVQWFHSGTRLLVPPEGRRMGVVLQSLALFPHMTAAENVAFGLAREARPRAREWLARFGVGHLAERRPATFSGGEAQRVALARALAPDRDVLVLDEPFSALDDATRGRVLEELRVIFAERERVIVLVTHHPGDVEATGARSVHLVDGRVVAHSTTSAPTISHERVSATVAT